jgi:hypothetical protein
MEKSILMEDKQGIADTEEISETRKISSVCVSVPKNSIG